jgi:hypothetical protein
MAEKNIIKAREGGTCDQNGISTAEKTSLNVLGQCISPT